MLVLRETLKLHALGRKKQHTPCILCARFGHSFCTSYPIFNFSSSSCKLTFFFISLGLLEVSANRFTYVRAPMAHTLPPPLPPTHLLSLRSSAGAITCPPLIPVQPHALTQQNHTHPPVHLHPSCL